MGRVTDADILRGSIHKALKASKERIELTPGDLYDIVGNAKMSSEEYQTAAENCGWIEIVEPCDGFTYTPIIGPYWVLLDVYQRNFQPEGSWRAHQSNGVMTPVSEVAEYIGVDTDILEAADNGTAPIPTSKWIEYMNKLNSRIYLNTWVKDLM